MQFVAFIWRGCKARVSTAEGLRFTNDTAANLQAPAIHETHAVVNMIGDKAMLVAIESIAGRFFSCAL